MEGNEKGSRDIKEKIKNAAKDSPITTIEINGQPVKCLLDTGAKISTISELFYKQLLQHKDIRHEKIFTTVCC